MKQRKFSHMLVRTSALLLACLMLFTLAACEKKQNQNELPKLEGYTYSEEITDIVRLNVSYTDSAGKSHTGDIVVRLRADYAPITVANFQKLVSEGFYNGLTFHRVMSGFMIQGGNPEGTGMGGSKETIKGEFAANQVNNKLKHERGTISMARTGYDYNSASSQFFIVHQTSQNNTMSLDGQYAAFGYVLSGIEHVDGIAGTAVDENNKPFSVAVINRACFVTKDAE